MVKKLFIGIGIGIVLIMAHQHQAAFAANNDYTGTNRDGQKETVDTNQSPPVSNK